ncbi:MAG: hypothetical protein IT378_25110 [Sandaracinaceae bacterium]|nr:hypothetical protein [Sandaracinaceae bacterium]
MRPTLVLLALLMGPAAVCAQSLRLVYEAPAERGCTDAEGFVDLVRARLGHAPFAPDGAGELRVSILADEGRLHAEVSWLDDQGTVLGRRALDGRDCEALADALAVVASIAVESIEEMQETSRLAPPSPEPPPPLPEPDPERPPILAPPPPPPPGPELRARLGASLGLGFGPGPLPHVDLGLGGGVRYDELGALLSFHYADTFATGGLASGYGLRVRALRARLLLCYLPRPFELCAAGSAGLVEGEPSGVSAPTLGQAPLGTLGALGGVAIAFDRHVGLELHLELAVVLDRVSFQVGGEPIWTALPVLGQLSVSFLYEP